MSHKRFPVELSSEERAYLQQLVASGSPKTLPRRRAQIWLLCDQGPEGPAWTDARTAEAVGVTAMTVSRARQALVLEGMAAALQRKTPPGRARWTLKLLAAELVALEVVDAIAPETVRRALQKTR